MNISNLNTIFSKVSQQLSTVPKAEGGAGAHESAASGNPLPPLEQESTPADKPNQVEKSNQVEPTPQKSAEELRDAAAKANDAPLVRSSNLKFSVAEGTNINVVRVEDAETGELIRQIPSEQMVALASALENQRQGMVLEEKV